MASQRPKDLLRKYDLVMREKESCDITDLLRLGRPPGLRTQLLDLAYLTLHVVERIVEILHLRFDTQLKHEQTRQLCITRHLWTPRYVGKLSVH